MTERILKISINDIRTLVAVANNLLMDLKIPKKHKQVADDVMIECQRLVKVIDEALEIEEPTEAEEFYGE